MLTPTGRTILGTIGAIAVLGLAGAVALSASPPGAPAPPQQPQQALQAHPAGPIHYHFHTHYHNYHTPLPSLLQKPLMPQTTARDAMTNLVAPSYMGWPYAPLPQMNPDPGATTYGTIHVFLPVPEAEVYLNGQKMKGAGASRLLRTGILPMNKEYQYIVTARYPNPDVTIETAYRKLDLGAGEYTVADFTKPPEELPARLPAGPVAPDDVDPN